MKWARAPEGLLRWAALVWHSAGDGGGGSGSRSGSSSSSSGSDSGGPAEGDAGAPATYAWRAEGWEDVLQVVQRDEGWQQWGYFLLAHPAARAAVIVPYFEDSYYSSKFGLQGERVVWEGPLEALFAMADARADPRLPCRRLLPEDVDYAVWEQLWAGVRAWRAEGCPRWRGRKRVGAERPWWDATKTPYASAVAEEHARRARAATLIQAAFRAWCWRRHVLFNPHTAIGRARLALEWERLQRGEGGAHL